MVSPSCRVVFFGNSESVFSNRHFRALMEAPCEIVAVVDVPPAKRGSTNTAASDVPSFVEVAAERGVPVFEPTSPNLPEFVEEMRKLAPDMFIAVGYTNLLKNDLLSVPKLLSANFHASLLPAYRGKHPVFWALRNGEPVVGLTVHSMDPGLDTGDILFQVRVRTRKNDTVSSAYDRIMEKSVGLMTPLVHRATFGRILRTPQKAEGASYYSSIKEEDLRLDWSQDAETLHRLVHLSPGQCFFEAAGRRIAPVDVRVAKGDSGAPGRLLWIVSTGVAVSTGGDALLIRTARVDSGDIRPFRLICADLGLKPGCRLEVDNCP